MGNQQQNPQGVTNQEDFIVKRQEMYNSSKKTYKEILNDLRPGHIDYDFTTKIPIKSGMQGDVFEIKSNIY